MSAAASEEAMSTLNRIHIVPEAVILERVERSLDEVESLLLEEKLNRWFDAVEICMIWALGIVGGWMIVFQVGKAVWRWMGQ